MKKRLLLGFVCVVLLFILIFSSDNEVALRIIPFVDFFGDNDISCYKQINDGQGFQDLDTENLRSGRNIFFHETSCFGDEGIVLNARQACAVESAARMNPSMTVYLLFVSPAKVSEASRPLFERLSSYRNVRVRHIFPEEYVANTPLHEWYLSGAISRSYWPRSHMSDILRYLTLWKFGGIYLDLDVVVTRSLEKLKDFTGAEDWESVAAGIMGFSRTSLGRRMAEACLRDLKKNFRGNAWGNNGPGVITRTLQKVCAAEYARDMTTGRCQGFKVYPPSAFYPVHYKQWKRYFETENINSTIQLLEKSLAIHVWNKLSKSQPIRTNDDVPYTIIARKNCPRVFNASGKYF